MTDTERLKAIRERLVNEAAETLTPDTPLANYVQRRNYAVEVVDRVVREVLSEVERHAALPTDGIRFDEETQTYVARHTILTAGRTEGEAREALASAVKLTAAYWPMEVRYDPTNKFPDVPASDGPPTPDSLAHASVPNADESGDLRHAALPTPQGEDSHCGFCNSAPCECPSPEHDDDLPMGLRRQLMKCATANGSISYHYLCHLWRRGRGQGRRDTQAEVSRLTQQLHEAQQERDESDAIRERVVKLLDETTTALKGEPAPLLLHSWHDTPDKARELVAALTQARAEGRREGLEEAAAMLDRSLSRVEVQDALRALATSPATRAPQEGT